MRVLLSLLLLVAGTVAAPGPEPRGVDVIAGTMTYKLGPVPAVVVSIRTPEGNWVNVDYWLVFTSPESERMAFKLEEGATVKAIGKVARGGEYRYLIVSKISGE